MQTVSAFRCQDGERTSSLASWWVGNILDIADFNGYVKRNYWHYMERPTDAFVVVESKTGKISSTGYNQRRWFEEARRR